nr:universal stress protein [Salinivibrio socompensis]
MMGAYGHSKLRQFFVGSNTTKLLIESTVPMLLIR